MKKNFLCAAFLVLVCCTPQETKAGDVSFDPSVRYSRIVIDNCLYHFKANTKKAGFAKYDGSGSKVAESESSRGFDYVPGLVAKAVLECVDLYKDSTWAAPWFYSIQAYGETYYSEEHDGKSLDDLNACKLYFGLYDLTKSGAKFENATVADHCTTAKTNALEGLNAHNTSYSISAGTIDGVNNANALPKPGGGTYDVTGGWWHKNNYNNQLWLDGQYMGPALLAQFVADGQTLSGKTTDESWDIIVKQFDITWTYLWNSSDSLLYHAFCADGGTHGSSSYSNQWEGLSVGSCYHSAEYWGRAEGWYVLALVDVLEQMDKAGLSSDPRRARLLGYLQNCAAGLKRWQEKTTGCWYQLLAHNGSFSVTNYYRKDGETLIKSGTKTNYLESSATAIFTATLLKGIRLGYLDRATYEQVAKDGYQGCVSQFLKTSVGDSNDYALINCCASAGLGGQSDSEKFRTGSAAYYLLGYDVTKVTSYTEGKVLGAFILAAVEYERAYPPAAAPESEPAGGECRCLRVTITE